MRVFIFLILFLCSAMLFSQSSNTVSHHPIRKVLLVVAMDNEAEPIIKTLNLKPSSNSFPDLPMKTYDGTYANIKVQLILNGKDPMYGVKNVGTQPATLATYLGIEHFHPDLIISIGTAGGFAERGAKVEDIYLSQKVYFYARRIPGWEDYGCGGYCSMNTQEIAKKIGLKTGIVCSGDSFDANKTDFRMMKKKGCDAIEMEAAGVAWVSMLTQTPMFAMKGITDYARDKNAEKEYKAFLPRVTQKLAEKLQKLLKSLSESS